MAASGSRHLVDPELLPMLDAFAAFFLTAESLGELRDLWIELPEPSEAGRKVEMERRSVPGPAGAPEVAVIIYRPPTAKGPLSCLFHIHGGGYVLGRADRQEGMHRNLAADLGCVIVTVDYRLAPETPFPGPVEDCYAALKWVFSEAKALGVDTGRIGVMGESAGGGLAAALALLARDRGERRLAFQHLIYPMLDDRTCTSADPHPVAGEFVWTTHNNLFGWSALLGGDPGGDGVSPYAAPARAADLSGLPPTFISTGALDLFLDEDLDYARRLTRAGVPVELHVYPGGFHAFDMSPTAAVAKRARSDSKAALKRALRK